MKIPKKVKVGGLIYKVKEVKRLCNNKRTEGYQYQSGQMIKLKKSLPKEYKEMKIQLKDWLKCFTWLSKIILNYLVKKLDYP